MFRCVWKVNVATPGHFLTSEEAREVIPFRYDLVPKSKIDCFEPKKLESSVNKMACRASMMGAAFRGEYHRLNPSPTSLSRVLWEAGHQRVHIRRSINSHSVH